MTRSRVFSAAWLAMLIGLGASLGGCGHREAPVCQLAARIEHEPDSSVDLAPQLFEAAAGLLLLPAPAPESVAAAPQSVQVQYAQAANQQTPVPVAQRSASIYAPQPAAHVAPQSTRAPTGQRTSSSHAARAVLAQQTLAVTERASAMAQKGMLFAAQEELVQALQLVAQSQDQVQGTTWRTAALAAGWTALDEANDFTSQAGRAGGPNVGEIIKSHRTTILQVAGEVPPAVAQQYYVGYAQQQLALAVGGEPAASQALHVLGKVHVALAGSAGQSQPLHTQRAMAIHQAALAVDPRNYQAANELGVLLASTGELAEAKRALLHSISIHPHAATWHNLATVHRRLGEAELAAMAENERRMMVAKSPAAPASPQAVTWVDAAAFAAAGRTESSGARVAGSAPALSASQSQRR